ncbi:MAG: amino acid adenylation domain-containing protein [Candidatus Electrothrix aestuarii]|uniref:Amino acid adenylation domain-containing protein n=1 Tax=Candidatus Electrothrix aestuarii TaxID=3062594 RepID=A0AAU8LYY4_9BACT
MGVNNYFKENRADQSDGQAGMQQLPPFSRPDTVEMQTTLFPSHTLISLFEQQVDETPDNIALIFADQQLTYQDVDAKANQLAHALSEEISGAIAGTCPPVAVILERSPEMIIAVLAVLKAGRAYVPIDPGYPDERIQHILESTEADAVFTHSLLRDRFVAENTQENRRIFCVDSLSLSTFSSERIFKYRDADELAYIIFTSGSTGRPKGVMISHRGAVNTIEDINHRFSVTAQDRVFALSSLSFDLSVYDIFGILGKGGAVVIPEPEYDKDPAYWAEMIRQHQITLWNTVPALMGLLTDYIERQSDTAAIPASLRLVMMSGDWIPLNLPARISALWPNTRIISLGGATEASIWSIWYPVEHIGPSWKSIPYGRALRHQAVLVLDEHMEECPPAVPGQLYIGGIGLALGYWKDEERTAAAFITHPATGERLYNTGDLGAYLPDGNIEFLGREDSQVKIRGFRVELGEIESALSRHPLVGEAVVKIFGTGDNKTLAAYYTEQAPENTGESKEQESTVLVEQWQQVFDETYSHHAVSPLTDTKFNTIGWNSSYTGEPISAAEMKEWLDGTISRILSLSPRRVLEIGCGTGMLLFRVLPHCEHYTGVDLSEEALRYIEQQVRDPEAAAKVTLIQSAADRFEKNIEPVHADTIIINSVIQYFPSINYLMTVLEKAMSVAAPGGTIFIGDIRNFQLFELFHTSIQFACSEGELSQIELKQRIAQAMQREKELLIDPDFFPALQHAFPRITSVSIYLKDGDIQNEMNRFRYDVTLHLDEESTEAAATDGWRDWQAEEFSLEKIHQLLLQTEEDSLALTNIPNARLSLERIVHHSLAHPEGTVAELRRRTDVSLADSGVEPEDLRKAAQGSAYTCHLLYNDRYTYTVVFQRHGASFPAAASEVPLPQTWSVYANIPYLDETAGRSFASELRNFARKTLPDYMIPSHFIGMESMPLTANGKIDRKALPEPQAGAREGERPRTPEEELLAELWAGLLKCEFVSRDDNFFEQGGNSLLAMQLVSRIRESFQVELAMRMIFNHPCLKDLAAAVETAAGAVCLPPISVQPESKENPLSFAQQRLWFLDQLEGKDNPAYNIPIALSIQGELDVSLLEQSLKLMVERHAGLRTCFLVHDGIPCTVVKPVEQMYTLDMHDLRDKSGQDQEEEVVRMADAHAAAPFDLENGPVFTTSCLLLAEQRSVLLLNMHHIVSDGWSMALFLRDWQETYTALCRNETSALPELNIAYTDYAIWQRDWLQGEILEQQAAYWKEQLSGAPELIDLPTDRPRPSRRNYKGGQYIRPFPAGLSLSLAELSREQGVTLFMTLMSAFNILLSRYSGQDDICVGSPIAGRTHSQTEDLIGFFVNTLVLRTQFSQLGKEGEEPDFTDLLHAVRRTCLSAYAHQDVPFEMLVEQLQPARSMSHSPLFQVMFVLQNNEVPDLVLPGVEIDFLETGNSAAKFDLNLSVEGKEDQLLCRWEYAADIFDRETIVRAAEHFEMLLEGIVENPRQPLRSLSMITEAERLQLIQWNETSAELPDSTLLDLFERQVAAGPDSIALIHQEEQLTYQQLDAQANQLAQCLLAMDPESSEGQLVAVALERSSLMVITVLAVLKAGAAYVPIDPNYPAERIQRIMEGSNAGCLITHQQVLDSLDLPEKLRTLTAEQFDLAGFSADKPVIATLPDDLAYIIFTSGSTGLPKGVAISHRGAVNTILDINRRFKVTAQDRILALSSLSFDLSVYDIFGMLTSGGTIVVPEPEHDRDPAYWAALMRRHNITLWNSVPALMGLLTDYLSFRPDAAPHALRLVMMSGDWIPLTLPERIRNFCSKAEVISLGGATEASIWSIWYPIEQVEPTWRSIPYGRPLDNQTFHVLDSGLAPCPVPVPGELYIGGIGLAQEYWRDEEKTTAAFITHPETGERLYRTGDLGRWLPDGNIEFLGRADFQVKIRGFRIELGEIEAVLARHPSAREAVVTVCGSGDSQFLAAYVTVDSDFASEQLTAELAAAVRAALPDYMVPSHFCLLDELPLSSNGKINRKALPEPEISAVGTGTGPVGPEEELLAALWDGLLNCGKVSREDSFFELGGNSLLAMQLVSRIRESFQIELPVRTIFEYPQLKTLTEALHAASGAVEQLPLITVQPEEARKTLSFAQQRLWFLEQFEENGTAAYNMPFAFELTGNLDVAVLEKSLYWLRQRHASLRTIFITEDGQPQAQVCQNDVSFIQRIELGHLDGEKLEQEIIARIHRNTITPFDLTHGPLFRVELLQASPERTILLLNMHHIISDGWSLGILIHDLQHAYAAFINAEEPSLSPLSLEYADYAVWLRNWLQGEVLQRQVKYWRQQLEGIPELLDLPTDKVRPARQSYRGTHYSHLLSPETSQGIADLSKHEGTTVFITLLAAFSILLSRYSRQNDICVGSPIANRTHRRTEDLVGFFVNTLVLRTQLEPEQSFTELLRTVRQTCLAAYAHQDIPFEMLVEELQPTRSLSHSPLFQVMLAVQEEVPPLELPGMEFAPCPFDYPVAKFDLTLSVEQKQGQLHCEWEYATDIFTEESIIRMSEHFTGLLNAIIEKPNHAINRLSLLTEVDRIKITAWNDTSSNYPNYPQDKTLVDLFEIQVQQNPKNTAVVYDGNIFTYQKINAEANRLALHLIEQGVSTNTLVGICAERSPEMLVAILAVFKAGGAYLPLSPDYPVERLRFMLEDSGAEIVLTQRHLQTTLSAKTMIDLESKGDWDQGALSQFSADNPVRCNKAGDLAYVIYTSGSTGKPKGVCVDHFAVAQHCFSMQQYFQFDNKDNVLQFSSVNFDVSIEQIFSTLLAGASLIVLKDNLVNPSILVEYLEKNQVSVADIPPAYWQQIIHLNDIELNTLRLLILGGEALSVSLAQQTRRQFSELTCINAYGPTEAVITATVYSLPEQVLAKNCLSVPIGVPTNGREIYILDAADQIQPIGVAGELCIAGERLALGYLNRPELTEKQFYEIELFGKNQRVYKTGDLARWLPDGNLEYLGRIDQQVQLRGFRIELGEIETIITQHESVKEAVVVLYEQKEKKLLAAYLTLDQAEKYPMLSAWLKTQLPDYMVPVTFTILDKLPLTSNGKIDRDALPAPELQANNELYESPRNIIEQQLIDIWSSLLVRDNIGIHDNFFELGGDSILSIQVVARAHQKGLQLTARDLFEYQTIAGLANIVTIGAKKDTEQGLVQGTVALTPIQQWFFSQDFPEYSHFNQSVLLEVPMDLNPDALHQAFKAVLLHHDALRLRFVKEDNHLQWQQYFSSYTTNAPFVIEEVSESLNFEEEIYERTQYYQKHLDITEGPVTYLVLFNYADCKRLFWCVHHLVVDGVSWRILQEDLHSAYIQVLNNQPDPELPLKTSSFKKWSEELQQYLSSAALNKELSYWQNLSFISLPIDDPSGDNSLEYQKDVHVKLSAEQTDALLREVPVAYNTRINDILLTALILALHDWTGTTQSLIDLEGHGRPHLFENLDLSRTVGWFTNICSVELRLPAEAKASDDLGAIIKAIKEQLRVTPHEGIGYSLLADLKNETLPKGDILFNYLGQFDQGIDADLFQPASEKCGNDMSLKGQRDHLIDINGAVILNQLRLTFSYSSECYKEGTIQALVQNYTIYLQKIITHCQKGKQGVTASDFPLVSLAQPTLDRLYCKYKIEDIYPLSPMQQGLLYHALYESETGVYFEQLQLTLTNLAPDEFKAAWQLQLERHAIFRSVFVTEQDQTLQVVLSHALMDWKMHDWREYSEEEQQKKLDQLLQSERAKGFDLAQAPLIRFDLIRLNELRYVFIQHSHHIITDGWSTPITFSEVRDSYLAFKRGQVPQLPRLRPYRDYIAWLQQQENTAVWDYWQHRLADFQSPTSLPILEHEIEQPDYQEVIYEIDSADTKQIQHVGRRQRVTLNTFVQAAWGILLSRYNQESDICFGVSVSGRNVPLSDIEQMTGVFINTLPLRIHINPEMLVKDYLQKVQNQHQNDNHHAHIALFDIQNCSEVQNGISLFDTLLAFENYPLGDAFEQIDDAYHVEDIGAFEYTNYPVTIIIIPGKTLGFRIIYDSTRVNQDQISRLWGHFKKLINALAGHPDQMIGRLTMLTQAELRQLEAWNNSTSAPITESTLIELVEQQVQYAPDNVALIYEEEVFTYQQVNQSANQLANYLLACNLSKKPLVAVVLERSPQMIISVLAVLKAGGTYIPIASDYPAERIQRTLEASGAECLITHQHIEDKLSHNENITVIDPHALEHCTYSTQNIGLDLHSDDTAYIIFTSGSTGTPKGVAITNRSVINTLEDINERFEVTEQDRILALSSLNFDLSVYDIFGLFIAGGALVIPPSQSTGEPDFWAKAIRQHQVTIWNSVPALMQMYTDYIESLPEYSPENLRLVLMSGDWIPLNLPDRIRTMIPKADIMSLGGATEASIWSILYPIESINPKWGSIPYGRPLRNQSFYVLDETLSPCPVQVPGHLYIGGIGLAQGYWRDEEKTQASFITHPRTGERLYRTGDLGRYLNDGNIEFLGRDDFQVKIHGFRIELGDIEAAVRRHPQVKEATVIAHNEEDDKRLIAYFVPQSEEETDGAADDLQIDMWQQTFNDIYGSVDDESDTGEFNIVGWNSSYTALPIASDEMRVWLDDTVEKICLLAPKRVLEIGCGTGMILFRVAPRCQQYTGLDLSQQAIDMIQQQINQREWAAKVTLQQGEADNFKGIEDGSVDTVIINSVVQYFPAIDYLVNVLEKATAAVAHGGSIFIGDVRNFNLLESFHTSVQLYRAESSLPVTTLHQRIQQAVRQEEELLVAPEFFQAIQQSIPRIKQAQILLKAGETRNEMNCFRYDVILNLDEEESQPVTVWMDWQEQGVSLSQIEQLLHENQSSIIAIKNIQNARLSMEKHIIDQLQTGRTEGKVEKLRASFELTDQGIEPDQFHQLAEGTNFTCTISYDGTYQYAVVFRQKETSGNEHMRKPKEA